MKTGLVIVHYNDYESLKHLMDNVKDYKIIDKIVIVDNKSNDDVLDKIRLFKDDKIKVIENSVNKGFSYAINRGCKYLIKELGKCHLIISNADIIINSSDDIKKLINYLSHNNVGVVSPVIIEHGNLNRGWKNPSPIIDALMDIVIVHRFIRKKYIFYKENHYIDEISQVEVVSGCFFIIDSNTLEEINYFDENTFLYYEENILAKKIEKIGKKIIVANGVKIIHNHAVSINKNLNKLKKLKIQKDSQYYYHKEYNHANVFERILLKVIVFINRIFLAIYYFIKDLFKR